MVNRAAERLERKLMLKPAGPRQVTKRLKRRLNARGRREVNYAR